MEQLDVIAVCFSMVVDYIKVYDKVLPSRVCDSLIWSFEDNEDHHEYINKNHIKCFTQLDLNKYCPKVIPLLVSYIKGMYTDYVGVHPFVLSW